MTEYKEYLKNYIKNSTDDDKIVEAIKVLVLIEISQNIAVLPSG